MGFRCWNIWAISPSFCKARIYSEIPSTRPWFRNPVQGSLAVRKESGTPFHFCMKNQKEAGHVDTSMWTLTADSYLLIRVWRNQAVG